MKQTMARWLTCGMVLMAAPICSADDAETSSSRGDTQIGRRLIEFFEEGFKRGPKVIPDAQRRYESLRTESKNDPRVDYAMGLVLLRQLKTKEAQTQFQIATKRTGEVYWPAWRALVWTYGTTKESAGGYERLSDMAKVLTKSDAAADNSAVVEQVEWIGQAMAAFEKMADSPKSRDVWMKQDEKLREQFAGPLLSAYTNGYSDVQTRHSLLEDDIRNVRDKTIEKREQERVDNQDKTAKELESAKEKRDGLKKTAEEWKKTLDEQLAGFDKQLARLEKDHSLLEKRGQLLLESQLQINRQMAQLQQQSNLINSNKNSNQGTLQNINAQLDKLQLQKAQNQIEYDQSLFAAQKVNQQAQGVIQQRNGVIQQYQKATGQLVKQDASLDKWQNRLKKDSEKLKEPVSDKIAAVSSRINQVRSFRTYIDLDVTLERDRLLESYGVWLPEKSSEAASKPES